MLIVVFLCLVGFIGTVFFLLSEPSYHGQSATKWFTQAEAIRGGERPEALKPIAEAFRNMGPDGLKFLLRQLKRMDSQFKKRAVQWIWRMPLPQEVKSAAGRRWNVEKRHIAVDILSAMGPPAKDAVEALVIACADEDDAISANAAVEIRKIAPPNVAIPILIKCLGDPRPEPVAAAAFCLLDLAENPEIDCSESIPALRAALGTRNEYAWLEVARALSQIDPHHAAILLLPNISKILSEPPNQPHLFPKRLIQAFALNVVENLGPTAKECLPQLFSLTNTPDTMVREAAIRAIAKIEAGTNSPGSHGNGKPEPPH